ncbi:MAG: lamin tail domain-containing protein, partial [candidate division Zixibacteria bacterium]|nr:lamin tail domain-containing protein [candidate division Zixibacteria bacterium]
MHVANRGLEESQPAILLSYFDRDFTGGLSGGDAEDSIALPAIQPDSVVDLIREYRESSGRKRLILQLPPDADSTDNTLRFEFGFGHLFRELVINEFVPNPDDRLDCEWIELKNVASYPVGLKGFMVGDVSQRYSIDIDVAMLPSQRVIVCEDTAAFINYFGPSGCAIVQPQGWHRLDNLGDIIIVENDLGSFSDSVNYNGSPEVGFSWERDEDSTTGAFVSLFYQSTDSSGATPCRSNSVRRLPPRNDIGFVSGIAVRATSDQEPVHFVVPIRNYGYLASLVSELRLYDDRDFDSLAEDDELIEQATVPAIPAGDSLVVEISHTSARGYHAVIGALRADDNVANNVSRATFSVGPLTGEIVITEFLANPQAALETEWVELKNVSSRAIDLRDWMIGDSQHQYGFGQSVLVSPRQYFVSAQDTAALRRFYGEDCIAMEPSKWSNLNNAGDVIILLDDNGVISDSLTFRELGDNNQSVELDEQDTLSDRHWSVSVSAAGSTPCRENSIHPLLPRNDLCLVSGGFVVESAADSASVALAITIKNCGYLTSLASEFRLYLDLDLDSVAEDTELIEQQAFNAIAVGDSLVLRISHPFARGYH